MNKIVIKLIKLELRQGKSNEHNSTDIWPHANQHQYICNMPIMAMPVYKLDIYHAKSSKEKNPTRIVQYRDSVEIKGDWMCYIFFASMEQVSTVWNIMFSAEVQLFIWSWSDKSSNLSGLIVLLRQKNRKTTKASQQGV